jgi:uncharacterized protein (DUF488 family)
MSQHSPPQEAHWPEGAIFTLGHSTLSIQRFLALLQTYGIDHLVDIRTIPRSRHNPQFNDTALANSLTAQHLEYLHIRALGVCGAPGKILPTSAGETEAFAATPIICKPRSFRTRLKCSFR